jgi:glycosyltransferase A (GT-A) superfamily protein (DUF2064 family)
VKTRLCPPLTPEQAAGLSRAFLEDRTASLLPLEGIAPGIAFTPDGSEADFRRAFPGVRLMPQGGGGLGERMARVARESLTEGHPAVLLLGADLPLLPTSVITEAARLRTDNACDLLFLSLPWSTPGVRPVTPRPAEGGRLRIRLTAPAPDCDTPDDLLNLLHRLHTEPAAFRVLAPRTAVFLSTRPR